MTKKSFSTDTGIRCNRIPEISQIAFGVGGLFLILAALVLPRVGQAVPGPLEDQWSPWKALDRGYMARRRIPQNLDRPVAERRSQPLEAQERVQVGGFGAKKSSTLWLSTRDEGLYGVAITSLAATLGTSEDTLRKKAEKGRLSLRTGGSLAAWYWDEGEDAILFPATAYETFYTDRNAYRFQLGDRKGAAWKMPVVDGAPQTSEAEAAPFPETLHFEEEPDLFYSTWTVAEEPDADYWFWDYLYASYKPTISLALELPDPAPTGTARFQVTLRGFTDLIDGNDHQVVAELVDPTTGSVIGDGSVTWDGFEEARIQFSVDQGLLNPEGTQTLVLRSQYPSGTTPGEWLDQVDVTYDRLPVARENQLWLRRASGGVQRVRGLTDESILVIEDPAGRAALLENLRIEPAPDGTWQVDFQSEAGKAYLVVTRDRIAAPDLRPDDQISSRVFFGQADYLILAPRAFSETAEALADYQRGRSRRVAIVWLEAIYNRFSDGRVDPSALERFMKKYRRKAGDPRYVTLIGKGTLDEKDRMGYGDSFLPVRLVSTPWALAASDARLLGQQENDSPLPFAIGRLPITQDEEGLAYVEKLSAQEGTLGAPERWEAALAADDPDDGGDFHTNSDRLAERLLDLGFSQVTTYYHPRDDLGAALADSTTWTLGYMSYDGHGSSTQIGDYQENFLNTGTASALRNGIQPIFTALTCAVADDTQPGIRSLASALVLNPDGGAIASLAPTGLSLDGEAQILNDAFVDHLFGAPETSLGEAAVAAGRKTAGQISAFMPEIYHILGDPSWTAW